MTGRFRFMQIKKLVIENFKSIEKIELDNPNPFTVFVGPNGSGKSNIFEALEFFVPNGDLADKMRLFGGTDWLQHRSDNPLPNYMFHVEADLFVQYRNGNYLTRQELTENKLMVQVGLATCDNFDRETNTKNYNLFAESFTRLFVKNVDLVKYRINADDRLRLDADNLELVLKRLLTDDVLKEEIFEWLALFVPGFKSVEIDERDELHWFEESIPTYFIEKLISDGTYNILALMTAVYQSDQPQFLCIEEPENGLHPQVLMMLVDFFRQQCEEKGHYIWLNTHCESIVRSLTTDEIVLVKKKNGSTQTRQIKGRKLYNLLTDEAWLSGALGGGLAW